MPLAIEAAVPKMFLLLAIPSDFILTWTPAGSLVERASTGFPLGHIVLAADGPDAGFRAQPLDLFTVPAFGDARDRTVAFDQEESRDAGDAIGVAGGVAGFGGIEQRREGDAEAPIELARIGGVVLRDPVHREGAGIVDALEERECELAHRTGDLEEGEQGRSIGRDVGERGVAAVEASETEIGRACAGVEKL